MSNKFQKVKFVKLFASSEYKIRNKAYKSIKFLLKSEFGTDKKQLSESDIIAMWKGLYVWLYIQDKPILHEEVVDKIANLFPTIASEQTALQFMKGFFVTMIREWPKLDIHRLDKYYMMVRDILNACLKWLEDKNWIHLDQWSAILSETVLTPSINNGMGMKLHFIDIILDEFVKAKVRSKAVTKLINQMILSMTDVNYQHIYVNKMTNRVIDRLIPMQKQELQVNLNEIGETIFKAAAGRRQMKGKMRKLLYKLAEKLKAIPTNQCSISTNQIERMEIDPINESDQLENKSDNNLKDITSAASTEIEPELIEQTEKIATNEPIEVVVADESMTVEIDKVKKSKKTKTLNKNKRTVHSNKIANENDEKRVTFGKKYTKKFSKTTTSVTVSLGTIKQQELKSILKRK